VPPLRLTVYDRISPKHPATAHQETAFWMAERDGAPVARVGVCIDRLFDEYQGLSWAWVGFFEGRDDLDAARALFDAAAEWAAARGATEAVGPASFTTNDECGLLVEGFEHPPLILTTHNPPYYERLWLECGWRPAQDLWGWRFDVDAAALSERQRAVLERVRERSGVRVRGVNMKDFDAEVGRFFQLYQAAWARNWGFAPMTEAEVRHMAKDLKRIIDPDLALFAERGSGEPVGVALVLPDANEPMRRVRGGRLLPTGWWHLLRGMGRVHGVRVIALGIRPEDEARAIGPLLYSEIIDRTRRRSGVDMGEASWVLASNHRMNAPIEAMGATRYKVWRMYQRSLG
jgi:hypothetical protein